MKRPVYLALGFVFVAIGALGVVLPILPTTPFILLAAACFAQSSERWHAWLMNTKLFGPMLRNWEENRCISAGTKMFALSMIAAFGGASVGFFLENLYVRLVVGVFLAWGFWFVARLSICETPKPQNQEA